ncbi:MAG: M23 family metallopeptidase [Eubacteriaceae bacterium]|nr:M23 family metallopeptidase [Eubacteriaceae bacterium]
MNKKEGLRAAGLLAVCLIVIAGVLAVSINERDPGPEAEFQVPQDLAGIEDLIRNERQGEGVADAGNDSSEDLYQSTGGTAEPMIPTEAPESGNEDKAGAVSANLEGMQNPVDSSVITMAFSYNSEPVFSQTFNEFRSDHTGMDIQADSGGEVKPAFDGKVMEVSNDPKLGTTIAIDHGNGIVTEYGNLDETFVEVGQSVEKATVIGTIGNSAKFEMTQPPHLHFGLKVDGQYKNPIDYMDI